MGTALKFVKVTDINVIPRYLFEQVKPREFDIDRLYQWAPVLFKNPLNLLGAFIDKEESVKGVMWSSYNPINNKLMVHVLSVDRGYQNKGILREVLGILKKLQRSTQAEAVIGLTSRPRAMERQMGCGRSNFVLMEKMK